TIDGPRALLAASQGDASPVLALHDHLADAGGVEAEHGLVAELVRRFAEGPVGPVADRIDRGFGRALRVDLLLAVLGRRPAEEQRPRLAAVLARPERDGEARLHEAVLAQVGGRVVREVHGPGRAQGSEIGAHLGGIRRTVAGLERPAVLVLAGEDGRVT